MKRILVVVAYAAGGLVLAGVVSLGAFAVTTRQLSETPEPIGVARAASVTTLTADGQDGQAGGGNGQSDGSGDWTPSWAPSSAPATPSSTGGDDDPSTGDDHSSGPGSDDDSSGPGSGDGDHDDSSGSGDGGSDDGPDDD
jgi:eukaryotic-like serine/threonine-protein kinase